MTSGPILIFSRRLTRLSGSRELVRQFIPNWFTATMGTDILALALNQLLVPIPGLHQLARGLWLFDIVLFVLFSGLYAARWIFFFDGARRIFGHSVMSMFFGAIPMGLATIINGFLAFGPLVVGHAALPVALGLCWIDVAMSLASGLVIPFLIFTTRNTASKR